MKFCTFFLLFTLAGLAAEKVAHRLPAASGVFPQGARPGDTVDAEILGEQLDRAARIVFLDSDLTATIQESTPTRIKLRIQASPQASYGPHYFRVITPRGASGPVLFRIGDQPRTRDTEPNSTLEKAQKVSVPVTIDGRLPVDGDFDFYRFPAQAGQTWIFDLRAARNGNGLDAALILLDAQGRKLAHSEDQFIWDPFFAHTFRQTGEYIAVIQPTHRGNDTAFAYELDIRQAPHLETIAPLSFRQGTATEATVYGVALAGDGAQLVFEGKDVSGQVLSLDGTTARVRLAVEAGAANGVKTFSLKTAGGRSNPVRFLVDDTPPQTGAKFSVPAAITGIMRYREPERFSFTAKKDEALVFEVRSQRFGAPTDSVLRVLDAKGKAIATNDDFAFAVADFYNKDSRLSHTFQEDGEYTLELRNLVGTTGENYPYQLRITRPEPHFELALGNERPYIYPGKEAKLKVTAARRDGHKAAIPLEIRGLPEGVTAEAAQIPEDKAETEIVLKASPDAKPGAAGAIEIRSGKEKAWRPVRFGSGGGEGATFARVEDAMVAVAEKPSFSLEAAATSLSLPRGTSGVIPVMIRREPDFAAPITFQLDNLPAGVTMEPVTVNKDQDRVDIQVKAAADAPKGRSPRVAILGRAGDELQEAPRIGIQVD